MGPSSRAAHGLARDGQMIAGGPFDLPSVEPAVRVRALGRGQKKRGSSEHALTRTAPREGGGTPVSSAHPRRRDAGTHPGRRSRSGTSLPPRTRPGGLRWYVPLRYAVRRLRPTTPLAGAERNVLPDAGPSTSKT